MLLIATRCLIMFSLLHLNIAETDHCTYFKNCDCQEHKIDCTKCNPPCPLEDFPLSDHVYRSVQTISIDGARFKTLNSSHLRQFPKIIKMEIKNSRLESIADDALKEVPKIRELYLSDNHLNSFPKIAGLKNLTGIDVHGNKIKSISYEQVKECDNLQAVNINYNNIEILEEGTFSDSCGLHELYVSHNDLYRIEEDFFSGLTIRFLDLSYTKISAFPTRGLKGLRELNVEGCKDLHRFPSSEGPFDEELCTNKTFPFLEDLKFEYHAHCCLYADFKPLVAHVFLPPSIDINQQCSTTLEKRSILSSREKHSLSNYSCINLQDGTIVNDYMPSESEMYALEHLCDLVTYCFDNNCPSNCMTESSGSAETQGIAGIGCILSPQPTVTFSNSESQSDTSVVPMSTAVISRESLNSITTSTATVCWKGSSIISNSNSIYAQSPSPSVTDEECCTTIEILLSPTSTSIEQIICPSVTAQQCCSPTSSSILSSSLLSSSTKTSQAGMSVAYSPTNADPPIMHCDDYADPDIHLECFMCEALHNCETPECEKYKPVCEAARRKRSIDCVAMNCMSPECSEFVDECLAERQRRNAATSHSCSSCSASDMSAVCSTSVIDIVPSLSFSLDCSGITLSTISSKLHSTSSLKLSTSSLKLSTSLSELKSSSTPSPTNDVEPPIMHCEEYADPDIHLECFMCETLHNCETPECEKYKPVCEAARRKRSIDCVAYDCIPAECNEFEYLCLANRNKRNIASSPSCDSCTIRIVSIQVTSSRVSPSPYTSTSVVIYPTSTSTSSSSSAGMSPTIVSTTRIFTKIPPATVDSNIDESTPYCTPSSDAQPFYWYYEGESIAECSPSNDPFNPCFHILDDDILRGAIWIVLLIAILGNGIVIVVIILHWIFKYRSHKETPGLLYMLYVNLAVADLFMGLYLCTIAIADIETKGHYFTEAIDWQTGQGCAFAGFCAIFSSILSIYTLLIITIERVYSIKFALQKRHFKARWVFALMLIGWVVAILLAILPIFGLSSYDRVSICLPFENREVKDKVYIAFILVITGVASFIILFSYAYLFYIVGCSTNKKLLTRSLTGKEEIKIAFRMSLLVFTDFATWGPIALFGLTAAFGHPLVNDIKAAKVLMVFVFPLNSCLNPILYSFSTRLFRNNVANMCRKCGLCVACDKWSTSLLISTSDKNTSFDEYGHRGQLGRRRSTQISLLSRFASVSSIGGDIISSRRGSTFSGSSNEDVPNSNSSIIMEKDNTIGGNRIASRTLSKSSWNSSSGSLTNGNTTRLKALPEEDENHTYVSLEMPHRKDSTDSNCSTSFYKISNDSKDSNGVSAMRRQSLPTILDQDLQDTHQKPHDLAQINGLILANKAIENKDGVEVTVF